MQGQGRGPVFVKKNGKQVRGSDFQGEFVNCLQRVKYNQLGIIDERVDVFNEYGVSRSLQCRAMTQAMNQKVKEWIIDMNSRWSKVERAGGKQVGASGISTYHLIAASKCHRLQ